MAQAILVHTLADNTPVVLAVHFITRVDKDGTHATLTTEDSGQVQVTETQAAVLAAMNA